MLLRKITKHVTDQNWFAVFLDFLIVVLGIWVALMVGQWTQGQKNQSELARVKKEINDEIKPVYFYAYERLAFAPCRKARYKQLGEMLLNTEEKWPGAPGNYGDGTLTKHRVFPLVLRSPSRPWDSDEWDAALSQGILDTMDSTKCGHLVQHYNMTREINEIQYEIYIIESSMQTLFHPVEMTPSDRLRYYDVLTQADARSAKMELTAEQLIENIETNNLVVFSDEDRITISAYLNERNSKRTEIYGDCSQTVELPLLNKKDDTLLKSNESK